MQKESKARLLKVVIATFILWVEFTYFALTGSNCTGPTTNCTVGYVLIALIVAVFTAVIFYMVDFGFDGLKHKFKKANSLLIIVKFVIVAGVLLFLASHTAGYPPPSLQQSVVLAGTITVSLYLCFFAGDLIAKKTLNKR